MWNFTSPTSPGHCYSNCIVKSHNIAWESLVPHTGSLLIHSGYKKQPGHCYSAEFKSLYILELPNLLHARSRARNKSMSSTLYCTCFTGLRGTYGVKNICTDVSIQLKTAAHISRYNTQLWLHCRRAIHTPMLAQSIFPGFSSQERVLYWFNHISVVLKLQLVTWSVDGDRSGGDGVMCHMTRQERAEDLIPNAMLSGCAFRLGMSDARSISRTQECARTMWWFLQHLGIWS